jgi:hypothetical protein
MERQVKRFFTRTRLLYKFADKRHFCPYQGVFVNESITRTIVTLIFALHIPVFRNV